MPGSTHAGRACYVGVPAIIVEVVNKLCLEITACTSGVNGASVAGNIIFIATRTVMIIVEVNPD